jgi:MinD superfamily P-loop ATPase
LKEVVVISGKGGTGKTSLVASFAALARGAVLADCDVDAADLHLVLEPRVLEREPWSGGSGAEIDPKLCTGCGKCAELCEFGAVSEEGGTFSIDPIACEGCGVCAWFCPAGAVEFAPKTNGELMVSETRRGPMIHARLGIAEENSGKLVTAVRKRARVLAEARRLDLILIDGSPGIGCPVIASVTGADLLVAVTEPTQSGRHDLGRVAELGGHFAVPLAVVVNKWDIAPETASAIEAEAREKGHEVLGRVRYDPAVTKAQMAGVSVVELGSSPVADDVRCLWRGVEELLRGNGAQRGS